MPINNSEPGINVTRYPNGHLATKIDSYKAATIARKFFEQYHSGVEIKDMALKDGTWHIIVGVDFLFERIKKIEIDANTGRIIRYQ